MKFYDNRRRKYGQLIVGFLLIGNVLGVFLVQEKDNIYDLQTSSCNNIAHQDMNTPVSSKTTQIRERFDGHEYLFIQVNKSWNDAKIDCESRGGYLVTITSQDENDFVQSLLQSVGGPDIWIGLTDELIEGNWQWVTGEPITYTNWETDEPNGGSTENNLQFYSWGTWNDLDGEAHSFFYVCEWELDHLSHDPIFIDGNADFILQAASEGWLGDGSEKNPFIIDELEISASGTLISIHNSNLYFQISNCILRGEGEGAGIELVDVLNSQISNNSISDTTYCGISLNSSQCVNITRNTIYNNGEDGINLVSSEDNIITDNFVYHNNINGIFLFNSSRGNIIRNNIVNNNLELGFHLIESDNCTLESNTVINSAIHGVRLENASHNVISSNTISNNQWSGIILRPGSDNNTVTWNNFIDNNASPGPFWRVQALDNGSYNLFEFNHWNEWTIPDINGDGYVDDPKFINYSNQDNYALVSVHNFITELSVLFPNGGESLYEIVTIHWSNLADSYDHETTYSIYYSEDNGLNWNTVVMGLNTTSYDWDTRITSSGSTFLLKVVSTCTEGLIAEDTSDRIFSINNELTPPVLVYPNGGEIIKGIITIQWIPTTDSLGHSIIYSLFFSIDNSTTWNWIISGLTMTSYNWDTTNITTGTTFLIKVTATCSGGGTREDTSDGTFSVHYITTPTIFTLERTLIGMVTIQWSASVDSLGQNVTYSVFYSSDRGSNWTLLASELTETSYDWNTTTVSDGRNYRIKVVATSEGLSTEIIFPDTFTIDNIPPNFSFLIFGLAIIPIIPELYLGRKFSNFVNKQRRTDGVENI